MPGFAVLDRIGGIGRGPRLLAVSALVLLAVVSMLDRPASHGTAAVPTAAVVVAARTLPAGQVLHAADLRVARWPRAVAAPGFAVATTGGLVGHRLASPVARGEPVTRERLVSPRLAVGLPPGYEALSISVTGDAAGQLLRPGDRVDVLASPSAASTADGDTAADAASSESTAPATTAARRLLVLAVGAARDDSTTGIVVAVDRADALRLVGEQSTQAFTAVLTSP